MDEAGEPETRYLRRESVTLAFLVALQALPARQRAVLLLRDVLEWHAREVSDLLEMSPNAVESALHRARATLLSQRQSLAPATMSPSSGDAATQAVLSRYVHAWEEADMEGLVALLREDAILAMPPLARPLRRACGYRGVLRAVAARGRLAAAFRRGRTRSRRM